VKKKRIKVCQRLSTAIVDTEKLAEAILRVAGAPKKSKLKGFAVDEGKFNIVYGTKV
jgi:hypothetical protein